MHAEPEPAAEFAEEAIEADPAASGHGLIEDVLRFAQDVRHLAHDQLELLAAETRASVHHALAMAVIAIVMAVVLVSAWLGLIGALVLVLMSLGLAPVFAMLVFALANLLLLPIGWLLLRRQGRAFGWPATLRTLKPAPGIVAASTRGPTAAPEASI